MLRRHSVAPDEICSDKILRSKRKLSTHNRPSLFESYTTHDNLDYQSNVLSNLSNNLWYREKRPKAPTYSSSSSTSSDTSPILLNKTNKNLKNLLSDLHEIDQLCNFKRKKISRRSSRKEDDTIDSLNSTIDPPNEFSDSFLNFDKEKLILSDEKLILKPKASKRDSPEGCEITNFCESSLEDEKSKSYLLKPSSKSAFLPIEQKTKT